MYNSQADGEWQLSPLYRGSVTDTDESLHPILQSRLINRDRKNEMWAAYSEFKVTKLPRGGIHECLDFQPRPMITAKDKRSKKTDEQIHQEKVEAFKKKEAKLSKCPLDDFSKDAETL